MKARIFFHLEILSIILLSISITGCKAAAIKKEQSTESLPQFEKVTIIGDQIKNGIFDISVEYGDGKTGWMAFSRVTWPEFVETGIAKTTNYGKTWKYVTTVNKSHFGTITIGGKKIKGAWRNETPSLLYDPGDIPSRRWKLFSQRYLAKPPYKKGYSLFDHGWIEYKTARSPQGPWSKPKCLFGKNKDKCLLNPNSLHRSLKNNLFYNEIGTVVHEGVIYLSVDASTTATGLGDWKKRKIVLFSSKDHGKSWKFTGTLTDYDDASDFGYLVFTGTSLVKEGNKLFLLATPSGAKGLFKKNRGHDGTYVMEFDNIKRAKLKRDKKGKLIVLKKFKPYYHSGGLSDYDEKNLYGKILFSQINTKAKPDFFQVFSTKEGIAKP